MGDDRSATIVGWHRHRNTGDDAMLRVISWMLAERFGVRRVRLLANRSAMSRAAATLTEARPIYYGANRLTQSLEPMLRRRAAARSDMLIFGGGSIFHSRNSIAWKMEMLEAARRRDPSRIVAAMGVSIGPFSNTEEESLSAQLISQLDVLVVRDQPSHDFASTVPLRQPAVLTYDLAVLLPTASEAAIDWSGRGGKTLGVSLRPHPRGDAATMSLVDKIGAAIDALVAAHAVDRIQLLSFCGDEAFGDDAILGRLHARLTRAAPVTVVPYLDDPMAALRAVGECRALLGMRLHSQVFAYTAGVPFAAIDYERKCTDFLQAIGAPAYARVPIDAVNADHVAAQVGMCLRSEPGSSVSRDEAVRKTLTALEGLWPTARP